MNFLLIFYRLLLYILLPIVLPIAYHLLKKKGDHLHFAERAGIVKLNDAPYKQSIWFHAASVGEVRSIKPIIDRLRIEKPDYKIVVSTFTQTGRAEAINYIKADEAFLIPLENHLAIAHIMTLMGTKVFVVVDTEIWPNMIYTAAKQAKLIMINARISDKTMKSYKRFSFIFGGVLKQFNTILTKSKIDTERFKSIIGGDKNIQFAGNIKFQSRKNIEDMQRIDELKNYFFIASTHASEEEQILKAYKQQSRKYDKIVIAPRHIKRTDEIIEVAQKLGYTTSKFSENDFSGEVVLVDAFGQLERLYAHATNIFIGGSLVNIGGHNIYEASQFRKHVYVGKYTHSFQDVVDIAVEHKVATVVEDISDIFTENNDSNFDQFFNEIDTTIANACTIAENTIIDILNKQEQQRV